MEAYPVSGSKADARKDPRVNVIWRGLLKVPGGRTLDLHVRDISVGGVGFNCDESIPTLQPLQMTIDVPKPNEISSAYRVPVTITAVYRVIQGDHFRIGATWQLEPAARELITLWVDRTLSKKQNNG